MNAQESESDNHIFYRQIDAGNYTFSLENVMIRTIAMPEKYRDAARGELSTYTDANIHNFIAVKNILANLEAVLLVTGLIHDACTEIGEDTLHNFRAVSNVYSKIFGCLNLPADRIPYYRMRMGQNSETKLEEKANDTKIPSENVEMTDITLGKYLEEAYKDDELLYVDTFWKVEDNKGHVNQIENVLRKDLQKMAVSIGDYVNEQLIALPAQLPESGLSGLTIPYPGQINIFKFVVDTIHEHRICCIVS